MDKDVSEEQIGSVVEKIQNFGHEVNISRGTKRTVIGAIGDESKLDLELLYKAIVLNGHAIESVFNA